MAARTIEASRKRSRETDCDVCKVCHGEPSPLCVRDECLFCLSADQCRRPDLHKASRYATFTRLGDHLQVCHALGVGHQYVDFGARRRAAPIDLGLDLASLDAALDLFRETSPDVSSTGINERTCQDFVGVAVRWATAEINRRLFADCPTSAATSASGAKSATASTKATAATSAPASTLASAAGLSTTTTDAQTTTASSSGGGGGGCGRLVVHRQRSLRSRRRDGGVNFWAPVEFAVVHRLDGFEFVLFVAEARAPSALHLDRAKATLAAELIAAFETDAVIAAGDEPSLRQHPLHRVDGFAVHGVVSSHASSYFAQCWSDHLGTVVGFGDSMPDARGHALGAVIASCLFESSLRIRNYLQSRTAPGIPCISTTCF